LGRNVAPTDDPDHPRVALVNKSFAEHFWPGQSGLGHVIRLNEPEGPRYEIVGIVGEVKYGSFNDTDPRCVYVALAQHRVPKLSLIARTNGNPKGWSADLKRTLKAFNPEMLLFDVYPYERLLSQTVFFVYRVGASFALGLAALALILAVVGLWGVISFGVGQRTREVGVRMALGAGAFHVLWMFVRRGLILTGTGLLLGLAVALGLTRIIAFALYGISSLDPATFTCVPALFVAVALLASYLPARRATQVDPILALRCE
jgi:putative ABC transport system permease protein